MGRPADLPFGATTGLAPSACRDNGEAEQVYVRTSPGRAGTHPVMVDAWVGYASIARMRLTRQQTIELAHLLIDAALTIVPESGKVSV